MTWKTLLGAGAAAVALAGCVPATTPSSPSVAPTTTTTAPPASSGSGPTTSTKPVATTTTKPATTTTARPPDDRTDDDGSDQPVDLVEADRGDHVAVPAVGQDRLVGRGVGLHRRR